ncbi:M48 family metallopeptidase [Flavobacterium sp. NG2]|uniref:M48 family metallopeptidase n=1 Tax=Flavobacterium sp. NG2 TaxID=3097547 RepID=UPI002A805B31|nr:M48 family metallopeptidase [Flavobacterium sp. NG2]WPR72197.1 M48 family metallopeptidase [Flavobacterium sp. NG2]
MKNKTTAVFYDGNSSAPQEIEVSFDLYKESICFESTDGQMHKWPIKNISFDKRGTGLHLDHGTDLIQHLKIVDNHFIDAIQLFRKEKGQIGWYQKLMDLGISLHLIIAIGILAIIGLSYLYVIPWVGEKSVALIPEEYDDQLGSSAWLENDYFVTKDSSKTKTLNAFAQQLDLNNSKKLKFTVVESDEINAFALPDGNIVVFTGIIKEMKNYDELVGLLGHEASHVNNRHSMKMLCRSLSGYLFVSLILGDANGVMAVIGDNVNSFQSLSFSREFEHQADTDGFKILTKNKVNPKGMSNLFERLQKEQTIAIPEFLSSHPVTENRIDYIEGLIKNKKYTFEDNPELKRLFLELKK